MADKIYLTPDIRYSLFVHESGHAEQVGPEAEPWDDGRPMHYAGITIEHRTADPGYDGRPGHPSREAGWCLGGVSWDGPGERWALESFEPLTLSPSIACHVHPSEFHIFIRDGKVA